MTSIPFAGANHPGPLPPASTTHFTITTSAVTDIWRKPGPPEISTFTAPILYKAVRLAAFKRARVTVSAAWNTLYDQGGVLFALPKDGDAKEGKWVKTGIEFYEGEALVGTVAKDRSADWSLSPVGIEDLGGSRKGVTLELELHPTEKTLWIYVVDGERRRAMREITWVLSEPDQEVWVGVYAARPTEGVMEKELVVEFEGWELELK